MTALALITRDEAVYLAADAAHCVRGGVMIEARTKLEKLPLQRAVFAVRGSEDHNQLVKQHFASLRSFDEIALQAGEIVRAVMARYPADKAFRRAFPFLRVVDVFVAGISARIGACGFVVSSDAASGCQFEPQPAPFALAPSMAQGRAFYRRSQREPVDSLAREILEAQRASGAGSVFRGPCYVGGFAELATVTAAGIEISRLGDWPDAVGARIESGKKLAPALAA